MTEQKLWIDVIDPKGALRKNIACVANFCAGGNANYAYSLVESCIDSEHSATIEGLFRELWAKAEGEIKQDVAVYKYNVGMSPQRVHEIWQEVTTWFEEADKQDEANRVAVEADEADEDEATE
jgi:hypothetical protein